MSDDIWWFHLYVMLSRATRMQDMLLLRPPPKQLLERGPPAYILKARFFITVTIIASCYCCIYPLPSPTLFLF